jgi:hypothetical protein
MTGSYIFGHWKSSSLEQPVCTAEALEPAALKLPHKDAKQAVPCAGNKVFDFVGIQGVWVEIDEYASMMVKKEGIALCSFLPYKDRLKDFSGGAQSL